LAQDIFVSYDSTCRRGDPILENVNGRMTTSSLSESDLRGISVHHLASRITELIRDFGLDSKTTDVILLEERVLSPLTKDHICPIDKQSGASYVNILTGSDHVGRSTTMLSYTWRYLVQDIVDTLMQYCISNVLEPKQTYVWICAFCVNQHRVREQRKRGVRMESKAWGHIFRSRVESIPTMVAMMEPWEEPSYLKRVWCIFEFFTCIDLGKECVIMLPPKEVAGLHRPFKTALD